MKPVVGGDLLQIRGGGFCQYTCTPDIPPGGSFVMDLPPVYRGYQIQSIVREERDPDTEGIPPGGSFVNLTYDKTSSSVSSGTLDI